MRKLFTKILLPVNFNDNTSALIQKAVSIANDFSCDLHLLHVHTPVTTIPLLHDGHFTGAYLTHSSQPEKEKLSQLKETCLKHLNYGLKVSHSLQTGNWQAIMKSTIISEHIDLALIPIKNKHIWGTFLNKININKLARQTQCPVLTISSQFNIHQLNNILVPVGDTLPIRKLTLATWLALQCKGNIHLMSNTSTGNPQDKKSKWCMMRAYQLLRDYTGVNIHCNLGSGQNGIKGMLEQANAVKADLIVVNSGKESSPGGWFSRMMGNYLYKQSAIPVLTVDTNNYHY